MGIFSSRIITYVDSVAYNMAGDLIDRPNLLKSTVSTAALMNKSIGDQIIESLFHGPHMDQRSFFRWAQTHFPEGELNGRIRDISPVDRDLVFDEVQAIAGGPIAIENAFIDSANITYWAERWLIENNPSAYASDWTVNYDSALGQMVISYEGGGGAAVSVPEFNPEANYLVVYYTEISPGWLVGAPAGPFTGQQDGNKPDTTGFLLKSSSVDYSPVPLYRIVQTYLVDNATQEETFVGSEQGTLAYTVSPAEVGNEVWERWTPIGPNVAENRYEYIWEELRITGFIGGTSYIESQETVDNGDGTSTLTVTLYPAAGQLYSFSRGSTNMYRADNLENQKIYLYEIGTGNATFDALVQGTLTYPPEFFPAIPLRNNNLPMDHPSFASVYPKLEKAYKRSTGGDFADLLARIEDNPNVGDIDYAWFFHGVELNTTEKVGLEYIYRFLANLIPTQVTNETDLINYISWAGTYDTSRSELDAYLTAQTNPADPLYGQPIPEVPTRKIPARSEIRVNLKNSTAGMPRLDIRTSWLSIDEDFHPGNYNGMETGELAWSMEPPIAVPRGDLNIAWVYVLQGLPTTVDVPVAKLYWQYSDNGYRVLTIYGLRQEQHVYADTFVNTELATAINDPDETPFFLPLHMPTLKEMSLIKSNQLAVSNRLIIFSSFTQVKQRWYQRGIFKIIFAIGIVLVGAFIFPGAGGLLGANLAVGTALGFTGVSALIVGAIANAAAALLLTAIIETAATALFGEKIGAIIAVIASFVAFQYVSNYFSSGSLSLDWGEMLKIDNLMKMTDSVADVVTRLAQGEIDEITGKMEFAETNYRKKSEEIEKLTAELLGYSGAYINPLMFVQMPDSLSVNGLGQTAESRETFLNRTLLTGADLAQISFDMIEKFPELSKYLPKI
jgi:hypothetical protein